MKIQYLLVATILACSIGAGTSFAQGTTPAPTAPAKPAPAAPATPAPATAAPATAAPAAQDKADTETDASDKSALAAKCSAEATKRGLRGKPRKVFRSKCKRGKT